MELSKFIHISVSILFLLCSVWIFAVVIFFNDLPIPEWVRKEFLLPGIALLAIGLVLTVLVSIFVNNVKISVYVVTLVAFVLMCAGSYFCYFESGWDAGSVVGRAWDYANGLPAEIPELYYSYYTNNIMIHCIEYFVFRVCLMAGITEVEHALYVVIILNCAVSAISSLLVYDSLKKLYPTAKGVAELGYSFYLGLVMLSPWTLVVYTDALALIMPVLLIWLYLKKQESNRYVTKLLYYILICFIGFAAYRLKATAAVAFIAIVITEIVGLIAEFSENRKESLLSAVSLLLVLVIMATASGKLFSYTYSASRVVLDEELACPFTHYLKMGFNDAEAGTFNFPDSNETSYISTYGERYDRNLSEAKRRIKSFLPFDIFRFEARKTLVDYHDGSFAYGVEGNFYAVTYPDRDRVISPALKNIFWTEGKHYPYLQSFFQTLWLAVLLFSVFFKATANRQGDLLVKVTLIGIFLFLCLFEARARYVYIFVPVYIIAFTGGFYRCIEKWREHFG